MNYLVITFRSRSDALAMRSYLSAKGVPCSTINAPRGLTQSCGIALKIQGASALGISQMIKSCPTKVRYSLYQAYYGQGGIRYTLIS